MLGTLRVETELENVSMEEEDEDRIEFEALSFGFSFQPLSDKLEYVTVESKIFPGLYG